MLLSLRCRTEGTIVSDLKRRESLRCLFASVASITVMDWLHEDRRLASLAAEAD